MNFKTLFVGTRCEQKRRKLFYEIATDLTVNRNTRRICHIVATKIIKIINEIDMDRDYKIVELHQIVTNVS
jgi:hypothetical protein